MSTLATLDLLSSELKGPQYWEALRELQRRGPLTWIEGHGGYWAATGYDVVLQMAQDWTTFSSAEGITIPRPGPDVVPYIVPLETDPPRQRVYRKQVNPELTAKALSILEEPIRQVANELIDTFIDRGSCDIAKDFARRFPGTVFFKLIIRCPDEQFQLVEPIARDITFEPPDTEKWRNAINGLREWADATLKARAGDSSDSGGVVNAILHLNDNTAEELETFADHELASGLQILVQGGIGTSASVIGVIVRELCEDRGLQERVRNDPTLIPRLIEECLRLEPPLPIVFRTTRRDVDVAGRQIKKGDKVGIFFAAANRDPTVFERPDELDLERPHYRHLAFGAGVHRCIGSNLARLQIRVAIEQLLARLSSFWMPEGAIIEYSSLQARGPSSIPLEFTRTS